MLQVQTGSIVQQNDNRILESLLQESVYELRQYGRLDHQSLY